MELLLRLFFTFLQIGLFSIGGGYAIIPLIQDQVVEQYSWVSQKVFTDIITISQMTPGPLAVNTSTFVGLQIAGIPGAILATIGCVIAGISISVLMYRFFRKNKKSTYVLEVMKGLKATSIGLIISAAATILILTFGGVSEISKVNQIEWFAVLCFGGAFFILRKYKLNPILLMLITGVIGGGVYYLFPYIL